MSSKQVCHLSSPAKPPQPGHSPEETAPEPGPRPPEESLSDQSQFSSCLSPILEGPRGGCGGTRRSSSFESSSELKGGVLPQEKQGSAGQSE